MGNYSNSGLLRISCIIPEAASVDVFRSHAMLKEVLSFLHISVIAIQKEGFDRQQSHKFRKKILHYPVKVEISEI